MAGKHVCDGLLGLLGILGLIANAPDVKCTVAWRGSLCVPATLAAALAQSIIILLLPPQASHLAGALLPTQTHALPWWYDCCARYS